VTYDNDATYFDSAKKSAAYSYQKRRQFSGLLGCVAELELINTVDFRPGNASPQSGILNQLRKACRQAQKAGKRIARFRSDSAAHQDKIFTHCDLNGIRYSVSLDKNEGIRRTIAGLKQTDWKTMYGPCKGQEDKQWAVTEYRMTRGYRVRVLILRWRNPDPTLFDVSPYCYHAVGTNDWEIDPMAWLDFHNGRMGTIEHVNAELKTGLGCDYSPSHEFEKPGIFFVGRFGAQYDADPEVVLSGQRVGELDSQDAAVSVNLCLRKNREERAAVYVQDHQCGAGDFRIVPLLSFKNAMRELKSRQKLLVEKVRGMRAPRKAILTLLVISEVLKAKQIFPLS
jgi:hypothetical protein